MPADQNINWGDAEVTDPRNPESQVWPWTMRVTQDYENDRLEFDLTGILYNGPTPYDTYNATVIFQNPTRVTPYADAFEVKWQILNGPIALVTVQDKKGIDTLEASSLQTDSIT